MTEATPSVRPIIENTGATATAAAETLMKTIAMDGNRINIPIDVRQVAERLGLEVQYLLLDSGTDGMIVKEAGRPCKVVVDALAHTHRRRFTLAHEIGHYVQKYQKYALGDEGGEIDYRDERSSKGTERIRRGAPHAGLRGPAILGTGHDPGTTGRSVQRLAAIHGPAHRETRTPLRNPARDKQAKR